MIHVILCGECSLDRETLKEELERHDDIRVVAEVASPVELLHAATIEQADAVVMESDGRAEMPAVLTHLFGEFPGIVAVVTAPRSNRATIYRQRVCEQVYEDVSLADVLSELRTAMTDYWARAND